MRNHREPCLTHISPDDPTGSHRLCTFPPPTLRASGKTPLPWVVDESSPKEPPLKPKQNVPGSPVLSWVTYPQATASETESRSSLSGHCPMSRLPIRQSPPDSRGRYFHFFSTYLTNTRSQRLNRPWCTDDSHPGEHWTPVSVVSGPVSRHLSATDHRFSALVFVRTSQGFSDYFGLPRFTRIQTPGAHRPSKHHRSSLHLGVTGTRCQDPNAPEDTYRRRCRCQSLALDASS